MIDHIQILRRKTYDSKTTTPAAFADWIIMYILGFTDGMGNHATYCTSTHVA